MFYLAIFRCGFLNQPCFSVNGQKDFPADTFIHMGNITAIHMFMNIFNVFPFDITYSMSNVYTVSHVFISCFCTSNLTFGAFF